MPSPHAQAVWGSLSWRRNRGCGLCASTRRCCSWICARLPRVMAWTRSRVSWQRQTLAIFWWRLAASCTDAGSIRSGNRGGSALSIRCSARSMWRWSRWTGWRSPLPAITVIFLSVGVGANGNACRWACHRAVCARRGSGMGGRHAAGFGRLPGHAARWRFSPHPFSGISGAVAICVKMTFSLRKFGYNPRTFFGLLNGKRLFGSFF